MATIITTGVEYAQFLSDLRATIQQEIAQAIATITLPTAETGGMELAKDVTRLSQSRIYALVSARQIPHSKRGNVLHFNRADLLAWVKNGKRTGKEIAYA
jgi:hypothetical protein